MKKHIAFLIVTSGVLFNASAIDFISNGLAYNITSGNTVETTIIEGVNYSGNVVVPETVSFEGNIYTVNSIGPNTFNGCGDLLTSVTIPNTITTIGHYAFYGCSGLTEIVIPGSVNYIGERGFCSCSKLTAVTIPKVLTAIESEAFSGCEALTDVVFESPSSVAEIKFAAFEYCSSLTNIEIPSSVTYISDRAFEYCSNLANITISGSVSRIGIYAFHETPWHDAQPNGVVYIGNVAYEYKGAMPENTIVVLPEGTKGITSYAFYGQNNLKAITIPNSVVSIGRSAFEYCDGLSFIYSKSVVPVDLSDYSYNVFNNVNKTTAILYVPTGSLSSYQNENQWSDFENMIEMDFSTKIKTSYSDSNILITTSKSGITIHETKIGNLIQLIDMTGAIVYSATNTSPQIEIPLNSKGVYLLKIGTMVKKIIY